MSVVAGINATKASLELAKLISDKLNHPNIDVEDVRAKVHEMLIHMVNAQVALGEAHVEIGDLRRQLSEQEGLKALDADMDFQIDGGFFVKKSEVDKGVIAYCPMCWKDAQKAIPMQGSATPGWYRCNLHKVVFQTKEHIEHSRRALMEANAGTRHSGDVSFWGR